MQLLCKSGHRFPSYFYMDKNTGELNELSNVLTTPCSCFLFRSLSFKIIGHKVALWLSFNLISPQYYTLLSV